MKKTDIAAVVFISSISLLIAYFVMSAFLGNLNNLKADVQTVVAIDDEIVMPSELIFNQEAINPTVTVVIGRDSNRK